MRQGSCQDKSSSKLCLRELRCGDPLTGQHGAHPQHDGSFTWGSWILDANKPPKAALERAVLIYETAFDLLELESARFDVRRDNENTLAFHRRFGAIETHRTEQDISLIYNRPRFEADRMEYQAILDVVRET